MSQESCERLAAGGRRDDFAKPKSLRAAEHAKEQAKREEERRQRERLEREQERDRHKAGSKDPAAMHAHAPTAQATLYLESVRLDSHEAPAKDAAKELLKEPVSVVSTTDTLTPAGEGVSGLGSSLRLPHSADFTAGGARKPSRRSAVLPPELSASDAQPPAGGVPSQQQQPQPQQQSFVPPQVTEPTPSASSSLPAPAAHPGGLEPWQVLRQKALPPSRPEDNYEISDKGGDSDAEDNEELRATKHVPAWCDTYLQQLKLQADMDPDTIFGPRVPPCVLEDIFTDEIYASVGKNRPKRKRGSSGDWKRDRLQQNDVSSYKCRMGHVRSWTELPKDGAQNVNAGSGSGR